MSPRSRSRVATAALVGLVAAAACKASAPPSSKQMRAPGDADRGVSGGGAGGMQDELESLQAELSAAQAQLQGLAAPTAVEEAEVTGTEPTPGPRPATTPVDRCERIEVLAARICELRDRMCMLADEHPEQARYRDACGRAEQSCDEARTASDECE